MTENQHQAALFKWAQMHRKQYPALMALFAIPNGLHTSSKIHAARAVTCGLKAGVPDLMLAFPSKGQHGLFIELKVPKPQRSVVSALQKKWLERLTANGYDAKVAYGWEEAKNMIEEYLK